MKLDTQELLNEFFEKEKDNFPNVSYDQFKNIVYGPWMHLKSIIEKGTLEEVRIKYFGNFLIYPKKVEAEEKKLEKKFEDKTISEKEYLRIKTMIKNFYESNSKD